MDKKSWASQVFVKLSNKILADTNNPPPLINKCIFCKQLKPFFRNWIQKYVQICHGFLFSKVLFKIVLAEQMTE